MNRIFKTTAAVTLVAVLADFPLCAKDRPISIARQGLFSSGGSVTAPVPGSFDETNNWLDASRAGNTAHIDHANVFFQIPAKEKGLPVVFLHGYGQSRMGWQTPAENIAAIIAVEPGGTPEAGSPEYKKLLAANVPVLVIMGDYIDNGPADIQSTSFWKNVRDGAVAFAAQYTADGGTAEVWDLPKMGITGNSHFLFQELNNKEIAALVEQWIGKNVK